MSTKLSQLRKLSLCVLLISLIVGPGGSAISVAFAEESETDVFKAIEIQQRQEPIEVPDFTLPSVDGEKITLSDYRGKVVFLNFWTTW